MNGLTIIGTHQPLGKDFRVPVEQFDDFEDITLRFKELCEPALRQAAMVENWDGGITAPDFDIDEAFDIDDFHDLEVTARVADVEGVEENLLGEPADEGAAIWDYLQLDDPEAVRVLQYMDAVGVSLATAISESPEADLGFWASGAAYAEHFYQDARCDNVVVDWEATYQQNLVNGVIEFEMPKGGLRLFRSF